MIDLTYLIFTITFLITVDNVHLIQQNNTELILCRNCGSDVSSSGFIFSKSSSKSGYSFHDNLFRKDDVLIQVFATDMFFHYPVITFSHSTCVSTGEWEEITSWFPGYRWKPCVCPECGAYIGFVFEPIYADLAKPSKTFYGLILTTLISEHFLNSLTEYPATILD